MILIAHRGNIDGRIESLENQPMYIDLAISKGYDVEIDVWYKDNILLLGHDKPDYDVDFNWFKDRIDKLWVHCKNIEAIIYFKNCGYDINYFWHENDDYTIIATGKVLVKPGKELIENSICCMPEMGYIGDITKCYAIMTDNIKEYEIYNSRLHN